MIALPGQTANCINLRDRFGDKYRIEFEESYYAERPKFRAQEAPWLMLIPCQHGHICPWGGEILAACTNKCGSVAKKLTEPPVTEMWQAGADGVNVKFHVRDFDQVAEVMKPRKRHRHGFKLSPERRQKLVEAGKQHRFVAGDTGMERDSDARKRTQEAKGDTLVV